MQIIFNNLKKISILDMPNIKCKIRLGSKKIKARMEHTGGTGCK
jgi:hypothetical protein